MVYAGPEVHKRLRMVARLFALLVLLASLGSAATKPAMIEAITWTPEKIASGSPCLFKVNVAASVVTMAGTWQGHPITLFPGQDRRTWYALAGVDVEAKPGSYKIELKATTSDGRIETTQRDVVVSAASYKTEVLRVPQKYVKPDAETLVRIEADKQLKKPRSRTKSCQSNGRAALRRPSTPNHRRASGRAARLTVNWLAFIAVWIITPRLDRR